jgi:Glyoxalase-like domain
MPDLDHLVYAVPGVGEASEWLARTTGVRPVAGGRHVGLGSRNALAALGDGAYLELIGPDPSQDVKLTGHPFGLADLTAPRLVTWAVRVDDIDGAVEASRGRGYDPGPIVELERERPDGVILRWRLTRPAELPFGGVVPFLIDWGESPHPSESSPPGLRLNELFVMHPSRDDVQSAMRALDVDVEVVGTERSTPSLRALVDGSAGRVELR